MRKNLFFDLDGTLTDPQEGIIRCIQHALAKEGLPVPAHADLLWCIGPPLNESMARLAPGLGEEGANRLVGYYRERFSTVGLYENALYPEIPGLLGRLSQNHVLYVATSKPQVFAREIIRHFGLAPFLRVVYGSELDYTRADKGELVRYILEQEKIDPRDALIVGDRLYDVRGAKIGGIFSVGVSWGYGGREELERAGADYVVDSVPQLEQLLSERI
jgi:phosphoglycolate phosphatase